MSTAGASPNHSPEGTETAATVPTCLTCGATATGRRFIASRCLCKRCYNHAWKGGTLDPSPPPKQPPTVEQILSEILAKSQALATGCILYGGPVDKRTGYGRHRDRSVHRFVWEMEHGPIPKGMHVGHVCHDLAVLEGRCAGGVCDHRRCVNVTHMRLMTPRENTLSSSATIAHRWANRTHCEHGHPFTEADTVWIPGRGRTIRICHACRRLADAERRRCDAVPEQLELDLEWPVTP